MRLHGPFPAVIGRPACADRLLARGNGALQALGDRIRVERVDLERDAVREFAERRPSGGDHGRRAGHCLEHRQPEALVERDVGDACGPAVEPSELTA